MMSSRDRFPEEGEMVVCSVTNVKNYGAFVSLDEYSGLEGFIHIAEVATGWVKYIRNYVREGQKVVCKVMKVYHGKATVDLSLKQVNEHQRRDKIREWKNETRAMKLLGVVGEKIGKDLDWCWENFGKDLEATYGSLYEAFEQSAIDPSSLTEDGFKGEWMGAFNEVSSDNIVPPFVQITGMIKLTSPLPDGIAKIREALITAEDIDETEDKSLKVEVKSLGTPRYSIRVIAEDYKTAEEELKNAVERIKARLGSSGEMEFKRRE